MEVGYLVFSCRFRKRVSDVDVVVGDTDVGFIFSGHFCAIVFLVLARDGSSPLNMHVFLRRLRVPPVVFSASVLYRYGLLEYPQTSQ